MKVCSATASWFVPGAIADGDAVVGGGVQVHGVVADAGAGDDLQPRRRGGLAMTARVYGSDPASEAAQPGSCVSSSASVIWTLGLEVVPPQPPQRIRQDRASVPVVVETLPVLNR